MKKRVFSLMMGFCLMAGVMSGCGDSEGASDNTKTNNVGITEGGMSGSRSEDTEQPGVSDEKDNGDDLSSTEQEESEPASVAVTLLAKKTFYWGDGSMKGLLDYEYDANNNQVKGTYYVGGSLDSWIDYEYAADNNLIKETQYVTYYNPDGSVWNGAYYEYDANNNLIKEIQFDYAEEEISVFFVYEYDANNNLIKKSEYDYSDGSMYNWEEYKYDANNNQLKETIYNSDGSIFVEREYENEYDANNNLIKQTIIRNGSTDNWTEYEYDADNNMIKETIYRPDGSINQWTEYEYITIPIE